MRFARSHLPLQQQAGGREQEAAGTCLLPQSVAVSLSLFAWLLARVMYSLVISFSAFLGLSTFPQQLHLISGSHQLLATCNLQRLLWNQLQMRFIAQLTSILSPSLTLSLSLSLSAVDRLNSNNEALILLLLLSLLLPLLPVGRIKSVNQLMPPHLPLPLSLSYSLSLVTLFSARMSSSLCIVLLSWLLAPVPCLVPVPARA